MNTNAINQRTKEILNEYRNFVGLPNGWESSLSLSEFLQARDFAIQEMKAKIFSNSLETNIESNNYEHKNTKNEENIKEKNSKELIKNPQQKTNMIKKQEKSNNIEEKESTVIENSFFTDDIEDTKTNEEKELELLLQLQD